MTEQEARQTSADIPLRVANCSGFYGDRLAAAREMVEGGPIDVLTGDWLAELTMLVLAKQRRKDPSVGYAQTFLTQMEDVLGTCLERGIKVVANAGGLNPAGCAAALQAVCDRLGLAPVIAYVEGDDILDRLGDLRAGGLLHLDTGEPFGDRTAITANAYLGCWGIVEALAQGADVVITGRVTDASVLMGPAAWHFGWARDDWDRLAGACVAGHIIECGCQATGGNYPFFDEIEGLEHPGFPIAEIDQDGSAIITKHPGTGGAVTIGTVTAQLLYEVSGPAYLNPDVTARFDTVRLHQLGPDRVRVTGTRGAPPPPSLKVGITYEGGYRNSVSFLLTGLEIEQKAALVERTFWGAIPGGRDSFQRVSVSLLRGFHPDPPTNESAIAELRITVQDSDATKVGRAFGAVAVEMALSTYPGMFGRDLLGRGEPVSVFWPALIPTDACWSEVVVDKRRTVVPNTPGEPERSEPTGPAEAPTRVVSGPTIRMPLGRVIGARSGDKGGNANLGLWARTAKAYAWLKSLVTPERLVELFPEAGDHPVERYDFPNLFAVNLVFRGLLGDGAGSTTRFDGQAKGLGEYLRARVVDVPVDLFAADGLDQPGIRAWLSEDVSDLTPSERAVALLAATGRSNREIAERLFLSVRTVETYLQRTYTKLGISRRTELVSAFRVLVVTPTERAGDAHQV